MSAAGPPRRKAALGKAKYVQRQAWGDMSLYVRQLVKHFGGVHAVRA